MTTIVLPTRAADRRDVDVMLEVLKTYVPRQYKIGLDIMGKAEDFASRDALEKIAVNINKIRDECDWISVHGFSGEEIYEGCEQGEGLNDMSNQYGKELLERYIQVGRKIRAQYVHVHGGAGYKGAIDPRLKAETLKQIRENMVKSSDTCSPLFPIGIEVLPSSNGIENNEIWRDCAETIEDCLYIVQGSDIKVTLDTCHYAASEKGKYIDIVRPAKRLGDHLGFLHISDVQGCGSSSESHFKEGVIPGNGRIGEKAFADFFKYIMSTHPNIGICVEVENEDYMHPEASIEGIKRVVSWLDRAERNKGHR